LDEQRRRIIIAEIENWRRNHLLPEHYCSFLLNLYTEGDRPQSSGATAGKTEGSGGNRSFGFGPLVYPDSGSVYTVSWKAVASWFIGACLIAGMILLAFHFNRFTTPMQIAIFSCFAFLFYILAFVFRRKAPPLAHLGLAAAFLVLVLGGFFMLNKLGASSQAILLYLAVICLVWCASAILFGYAYLMYLGGIGLGLLYGVATIDRVGSGYRWWQAELYWMPIAIMLIGMGFLLHNRHVKWAGALAVCGILYGFGAELQSLAIPEAKRDIIQLLLFIKVFAVSVLFFLTRRYWFQWLRL
jgi:cellulose synthase/poly-beta-1,6-N-acetylglucosamine synthase-like glycosyltransferase